MRSDRIDRVLSFLEVLDRFKSVYRVSYLADGSRREGGADHAWHMCRHIGWFSSIYPLRHKGDMPPGNCS